MSNQNIINNIALIDNYLNKSIVIYCFRHTYMGVLRSFDNDKITLSNGGVIFDTGDSSTHGLNRNQLVPENWAIYKNTIEGFKVVM